MRARVSALLLALAALPAPGETPASPYLAELAAWRAEREAKLRSDTGWLTVAGLFWLEPGRTRFGSGPDCPVRLPPSAPAQAGELELAAGRARYTLAQGVAATIDGRPAPLEGALRADRESQPTVLAFGPVTLFVIQRGERVGVRVKDRESAARLGFEGLEWYPASEQWRVEARFVPHRAPRTVAVPNVLGQVQEMPSPGYVVFSVRGRELRLDPVLEAPDADELFFIFRDATTGHTTYAAGRFLYTPLPRDGRVVLDFNKAQNPPCAFTPWATCPLPPKQNRLDAAIEAGERHTGRH